MNAETLGLDGSEEFAITGLSNSIQPRQKLTLEIKRTDGSIKKVLVTCRIDTQIEVDYYNFGGILPFVLGQILSK